MPMLRRVYVSLMLVMLAVAAFAQSSRPGPQQPARDTPAQQKDTPPPPGGRISGRVIADNGRPVKRARAFITAAELSGGRGALTDDKGQYRVWGLMPGDYYINAVTRLADFGRGGGPGGRGGPGGAIAGFIGGALGGNIAAVFGGAGDDQDRLAYAPTYFPGVGSANEARPITVGLSQEVL